jgi:hypothetical protein
MSRAALQPAGAQPQPTRAVTASVHTEAASEAIQRFSCEVEYISHLAETLRDHIAGSGDMQSEALAHAIMRVSEGVGDQMVKYLETEASHV